MGEKIIVEFYGLPGSGKTTIVNQGIKKMKSEYKVSTLENVYFYRQGKFNSPLIFIKSIIYYGNLALSIRLLKSFKYMSKERLFDSLRLLKFRYQLIKFIENEEFDVLILEEGLIQYLSSVAYNDLLNSKQMKKLFKASEIKSPNYYYVNISIDEKISLNRIRKRATLDANTAKRRTESLSDKSALNLLSITKANMDLILHLIPKSNHKVIRSDNLVTENVKLINSFIEDKFILNKLRKDY